MEGFCWLYASFIGLKQLQAMQSCTNHVLYNYCNLIKMLAFRWFNRLTVQSGDCVDNKCSDIEEELVRWRGRLWGWQIVRKRKWFICKKLMFADWQSLVNRQFSAGRWRMLNRDKLIRCSILAICSANVKVYLKLHVRLLCLVNHVCTSYAMYSEWFVNTAAGLDPQQTTVWDVISQFIATIKVPANILDFFAKNAIVS